MDSSQDMSGNDKDLSVGVEGVDGPKEEMHHESDSSEGESNKGDPLYVQKRLKQQRRAHEREMRELQSRIENMQSQLQKLLSAGWRHATTLIFLFGFISDSFLLPEVDNQITKYSSK